MELELEVLELLFGIVEVRLGSRTEGVVGFGDGEFENLGGVVHLAFEGAPGFDAAAKAGELLHDAAGVIRIVPEGGFAGLLFEFGYARFI